MMVMEIKVSLADSQFVAGVVITPQVKLAATPAALAQRIDALVARRAGEEFPPPMVKDAIRQMLRRGGFRPSGRNKPASEYLAQAAREGRFPRINNLVDINNVLSLESGLPISLLDLGAVSQRAEIRYGREGERYVFNAAGQEIDLEGLVCVCRVEDPGGTASVPLGNPVKDSMAGKVNEKTTGIVGVIYGSTVVADAPAMAEIVAEFARLLEEHAGAAGVERRVLAGGQSVA